MRSSKATGVPLRASRDIAPATSATRAETFRPEEGEPANRVHRLGPVEQGEAFLGPEIRRLKPGFSARPRSTCARHLKKASPSPSNESARCASGAEIPARPDRALLRESPGRTFLFSIPTRSWMTSSRIPLKPRGEDVGTEQHHRAHFRSESGRPMPQGWLRTRLTWAAPVCRRECARRPAFRSRC